jgi:hypothetical protein
MTKKGDIPITVFTVFVVALCIFTLLSFSYSSGKIYSDFLVVKEMQEVNTIYEEFSFYRTLGFSDSKAFLYIKTNDSHERPYYYNNPIYLSRDVISPEKISKLIYNHSMEERKFFGLVKGELSDYFVVTYELDKARK